MEMPTTEVVADDAKSAYADWEVESRLFQPKPSSLTSIVAVV
jgi:hypothetical protein